MKWKTITLKRKKQIPEQSPEDIIKKAMEEHSKPSGFPKDWRNRVLKSIASPSSEGER